MRFRRSVPPRTYFTILTVQGLDESGIQVTHTRRQTYTINDFTTEDSLFDTAMADLLEESPIVDGSDRAATLFWYAMTRDASL